MALFGGNWLEDDRLSKSYEDKYVSFGGNKEQIEYMINNFNEALLESVRPKMTWLVKENYRGLHYYICSNCKNEETYMAKFCPECGAKYEASY